MNQELEAQIVYGNYLESGLLDLMQDLSPAYLVKGRLQYLRVKKVCISIVYTADSIEPFITVIDKGKLSRVSMSKLYMPCSDLYEKLVRQCKIEILLFYGYDAPPHPLELFILSLGDRGEDRELFFEFV